MKRFFLLLAAWCCLGLSAAFAYNPYAPNQFDAVDRNTWEYKAVYDLSKANLTGAPLSRFAPSYNLTRYEVTEMIAQAMKNRSKATPDQQKEIDKLAASYADDLQYVTPAAAPAQPAVQGIDFNWRGDK
ncbi:MAG: hypothetical protein ACI4NR_05480 [Megasphaera sp.]|uniref:hypothetical protein n=1 Tax=Megasphaera sp. TaxID=2023260 RepID=UPI003F0D3F01